MTFYGKRSMCIVACLISVAVLTGCGNVFVSIPVPDSVIASCVRSSGFPDGTQYSVEEAFKSDGLNRRVVRSADITADEARRINRCIEAQVKGDASLPDVFGVPQRVETVSTGTTFIETYTYGTPPVQPNPPAQLTPQLSATQPGTGKCNLRMTGGSGYTCEVPFNSRRN